MAIAEQDPQAGVEQDPLTASLKQRLYASGALKEPGPTIGEYAKSAGGGLASGLVSGVSDIALGVGRGLQAAGAGMVSMLTGASMSGGPPEGDPITAASDAVASFTRNTFPSVDSVERAGGATRFFARTLPEFVGGAAPYLAGGELAAAAKLPAMVAQRALPMFMGAMASGQAGFQDAIRSGASMDTAWASYLANAGVGATAMGMGPLPKILARAETNSLGVLSRMLQGAAVGAGQTGAADIIAAELYDESDRNTVQRMLESGAAGGLSTVLLESLDIAYRKALAPPPGKVPTAADVADAPLAEVPVPEPKPGVGSPPEPTGEPTANPPENPEISPVGPKSAPGEPERAPGQLVGNPSVIPGRLELPDGRSLPIAYGVVEAGSLQPSHDPRTFQPNPLGDKNERSYDHPTEGLALREGVRARAENLNPAFLVTDTPTATDGPPIVKGDGSVLGGNGRTMSVQLAYGSGKADAYRAAVDGWAKKNGLDISSMKEPVLVRVVSDEQAGKRGELSADLNESHTLGKTSATVAVSRGARIDEQAARAIAALVPDGGSIRDVLSDHGSARAVLGELVRSGAFTDKDVLEYTEGGALTEVGKQAVEQALMGAAVPDIYSLRAALASLRVALLKSLGGIIRSRAAWPDMGQKLATAVEAITDARSQGLSVTEARQQATIEPRPWKEDRVATALAQAIEGAKGKTKALFQDLGEQLQSWKTKQGGLFGPPPATAEAAFWNVMEEHGIRSSVSARPPGEATPNPGQEPQFLGMPNEPHIDPAELDPRSTGFHRPADPILGGMSEVHAEADAAEQLDNPVPIGYGKGGLGMTGELSSLGKDWDGAEIPSRQQIVKEYAKLLQKMGMTGAQFRLRRMTAGAQERKLVGGQFFIRSGVLRLARRGDLSTAPHEFAHALEKVLFGIDMKAGNAFGSSAKDLPQSKAVIGELQKLGLRMYPNAPKEIVLREGWAEFWREWFNKPETVAKLAPATTAWAEGPEIFGKWPELAEGADNVRQMVDLWRRGGGLLRVEANIAHPADPRERKQRLIDKVRAFSFQESFLDVGWALKTLQEHALEYTASKGKSLATKDRIHDLFQQYQMTAGPVVRHFIEHGTTDLLGQKTGMSYVDALRPAEKGGRDLFDVYMYAKRAVALITDPIGARDPGISIQDARAALRDIKGTLSPEEHAGFETAAANYQTWLENVNAYCSQLSDTYAHQWDGIQKLDQQRMQLNPDWRPDYAPMRRDLEGGAQMLKGYASRGYSLESSPLRKLHGSGARVISTLWEAPMEAQRRIQAAQKFALADAARRLEQVVPDVGNLITKVPPDFKMVKNPTYDELLTKLEENLNDHLGGGDVDIRDVLKKEGVDPQVLEDSLGDRLAMFTDTAPGPNGQPTISLWNAETKKLDYYEVSLGMQKALTGMNPYRLQGALAFLEHGLFQVPKQIFTMGTTGLRMTFSWITNPQRDVQTLYLNTTSQRKAPELAWVWAKTMKNALSGALSGKNVDWAIDFYKAHGLEMNLPLGQDTNHVDTALNKAFGRDRFYRTVQEKWDFFKDFMQIPEMVTRVTELKAVAKDAGWEPGMPMSEDLAQKMVLAAKNVSVNFTQGGELARAMNRVAPFFNASIQGPYAGYQAYKRNPAGFMLRGLSIAASSAALWWLVKDQDWYKELPAQEKYSYWHVPWQIGEQKGVWRIPMSHEIGVLFGSLPMATLDALNEQDPRAAGDWAQTAVAQTLPNVAPVLLNEALMQASNKDFFSGMPIVPRGQQDMPVEEQAGDYTTRASQFLGGMFGWSPRRIDHAIRGLAGSAALDMWALPGRGQQDRPWLTEPSDIPVIGSSFQRGGQAGTQPRTVTDVYDLYARYFAASRSSVKQESLEDKARRLALMDATQAISAMTYIRSHTNEATKRNAITEETTKIARSVLATVQGTDIYNRGYVHSAMKTAEMEKKLLTKFPTSGGSSQ